MLPTLRTRPNGNVSRRLVSGLTTPLERVFEEWFDATARPGTHRRAAEITEDDEAVRVSMEAPGYREDELDVSVDNGFLWISARPSAAETGEGGEKPKVWLREWATDTWERSFRLPRAVDVEGIEAFYENGILTVVLPKRDEARPRRIPVEGARKKGLLGRSKA